MLINRFIRSLGLACAASLPLAGCSERVAPAADPPPRSAAADAPQPEISGRVPAGASASGATRDTAAEPESRAEPDRRYVPLSRVTETWGPLQLSRTRARVAAFAGGMELEHAGVMPASAGSDLAGAQVFRILNGDDYFARNNGRNAFCAEPPRWLAVRHESGDARPGGEIWVALLTSADWTRHRPDLPGYCAGGLYAPETSAG